MTSLICTGAFPLFAPSGTPDYGPGQAEYEAALKAYDAGFDAFVEQVCKPYYAPRMGAPSLPPGRYFRMQ